MVETNANTTNPSRYTSTNQCAFCVANNRIAPRKKGKYLNMFLYNSEKRVRLSPRKVSIFNIVMAKALNASTILKTNSEASAFSKKVLKNESGINKTSTKNTKEVPTIMVIIFWYTR